MEDLLMRNRIRNILQSQIMGGCDMSGCALSGGRKKRAPSAYNKFVSAKLKQGHTMKEAIKLWRQSSGYKKKSTKRRSKKGSALTGGLVTVDKDRCAIALQTQYPFLSMKQAKKLVKDYFLYDDVTGECNNTFKLPPEYSAYEDMQKKNLVRELGDIKLTPAQLKKKRTLEKLQKRLASSTTEKGLIDKAVQAVSADPLPMLREILKEK